MPALSDDDVTEALADLPGWKRAGAGIVRDLRFSDFRAAVAFVVRLAFEAEEADHHPDLDIRYNQVRVALTTHSEGGITAKDLDLARAIQELAP